MSIKNMAYWKAKNSPLKQETIEVPFEVSGKKFPHYLTEEYQEMKKNAIFSSDLNPYTGLRKDHPIAKKATKESKEGVTYEHRYWQKDSSNTIPWKGDSMKTRGDLMPGFPRKIKRKI